MDRKSKIFFLAFGLIILASVAITFNKYFILKDYYIQAETECDPTTERCFVYECDLETEECSENPEENISYYKLITKKAYMFPDCDPNNDENCPALQCAPDEDCKYSLCEEDNEAEDIVCNDPEEYIKNNPPEEEEAESLESEQGEDERAEESLDSKEDTSDEPSEEVN